MSSDEVTLISYIVFVPYFKFKCWLKVIWVVAVKNSVLVRFLKKHQCDIEKRIKKKRTMITKLFKNNKFSLATVSVLLFLELLPE